MNKQNEIEDLQKRLDHETNHRNRLQFQVDVLSRQRKLLAACLGSMSEESDLINGFASGNYDLGATHHFRYTPEEGE